MKIKCGMCRHFEGASDRSNTMCAPRACYNDSTDPACTQFEATNLAVAWGYAIIEGVTRAAKFRAYRHIVERYDALNP